MRLALANDDFEWDDEETSYYDDDFINVDDNDSSYEFMCIESRILNPPNFIIVDGRMVIRGKELEIYAFEYLGRYLTLRKEIQGFLSFWVFREYDIGILFREMDP